MNELSTYNYDQYKNDNKYVSIVVTGVSNKKQFLPNIDANIFNKTNEIIRVTFSDTYFISSDRIQHDIKYHSLAGSSLEIFPNVGKKITFSFISLKDIGGVVFSPNDLVISTFYIKGIRHVIGIRIGNVIDMNNILDNKPIINKPQAIKPTSTLSSCFIAILIIFGVFLFLIIVSALIF